MSSSHETLPLLPLCVAIGDPMPHGGDNPTNCGELFTVIQYNTVLSFLAKNKRQTKRERVLQKELNIYKQATSK